MKSLALSRKEKITLGVILFSGIGNSDLNYQEGELTLTYTGGEANCHGHYERKTIIRFTCDVSKNGSDGNFAVHCIYLLYLFLSCNHKLNTCDII